MTFDFDALASRKVAGVPLPIVGAVLAAGAIYGAVKLKPSADPAPVDVPPDDGSGDAPTGDASADGQPTFFASPSSFPTVGIGSQVSANTQDTDAAWTRRATEWLIGQGEDSGDAARAMSKYVQGSPLTYDEGRMRDLAVAQFGLPPENIPTGKTGGYKGPASSQGQPPLRHMVKGVSDDSFGELANLYYHMNSRDAVNLIESANPGLSGPFAPGTGIKVPEYRNPKYYRATNHVKSVYEIARKNGTTPQKLYELNDQLKFPVKSGTRVRVK